MSTIPRVPEKIRTATVIALRHIEHYTGSYPSTNDVWETVNAAFDVYTRLGESPAVSEDTVLEALIQLVFDGTAVNVEINGVDLWAWKS